VVTSTKLGGIRSSDPLVFMRTSPDDDRSSRIDGGQCSVPMSPAQADGRYRPGDYVSTTEEPM